MKANLATRHLTASFATALLLGAALTLPTHLHAKAGATDPIPGTSNGAKSAPVAAPVTTGGGSRKPVVSSPVPVTTPAPLPVNTQPLIVAPLTFTAAASVNNSIPVCTGSYRVDPYYPTLSLMTVSVQTSSVSAPDGTQLYVTVNLVGGTGYPSTGNVISILSGSGSCNLNEYVTPGTTISSVIVSDASGAIISAGN